MKPLTLGEATEWAQNVMQRAQCPNCLEKDAEIERLQKENRELSEAVEWPVTTRCPTCRHDRWVMADGVKCEFCLLQSELREITAEARDFQRQAIAAGDRVSELENAREE